MIEFTREDVSNLRRLIELGRAWGLCPEEYIASSEKLADAADANLDFEEMRSLPPTDAEVERMATDYGDCPPSKWNALWPPFQF